MLRGDAMRLCLELLSGADGESLLQPLLAAVQARCLASSVVGAAEVQEAFSQLRSSAAAPAAGEDAPADPFVFVDVLQLPRVAYDPVRKSFHRRGPPVCAKPVSA